MSVVLLASATGTALTGVGLPVGASLASLAALCGFLSVSTGASLKRVVMKVNKHEQIVTLCRNTISSINTSVSQALSDNVISHEEFVEVKNKVQEYGKQKDDIRNKKKVCTRKRKLREVKKAGRNGDHRKTCEKKVKLDLAISLGTWLMPSRMIINSESTVGYR